MPVQQPPITGDPQVDSFNQQVANAINEMPLGNVITTERIVGTDIAGSQGRAGADGFNRATVFIYQRTGINEVNGLTAPDPISNNVALQYTYDNSSLLANDGNGNFIIGPPWEGWYNYIPERDPVARNDYIWFQAVNIADRGPTDLIASSDWSAVGLFGRPGIGSLRTVVDYTQLVDGTQDPNNETYRATITHIYLGETDVTAQILPERICWLIAEDDGSFAADNAILVNNNLPATYSDRNFTNGAPNRTGFTADFPATEIFMGSTASNYSHVSRDIEPRIEIAAVVNI